MGRLGPLTSQALGRSPYDGLVRGEGEDDPAAPQQEYDDRGRPVNPETKRINKDVVRSHNEVMLVIGVAEPENGGYPDAQVEMRARRTKHEDKIGRRLWAIGNTVQLSGVWGVNGLRQRILLYREYAHVPLAQLYKHERSQASIASFFLAGLPSYLASIALGRFANRLEWKKRVLWARPLVHYARLHLDIYVFMQRMGLMSSSAWFPEWRFFVPFSQASPIAPPPPLVSLSPRGVLQWLGAATANAFPLATYLGFKFLQVSFAKMLSRRIHDRLPAPSRRSRHSPPPPQPPSQPPPHGAPQPQLQQPVEPASLPATATPPVIGESQPQQTQEASRDETTMRALEGQPLPPAPATEQPPAAGSVRRQSTISSRADDYVSDEEEGQFSATLISFDVEATESTDTPPGVWSAELRPNIIGDPARSLKEPPVYSDNSLSKLPAGLAADTLGLVFALVLLAPYEALALRLVARSCQHIHGMPLTGIYGLDVIGSFSWRAAGNFVAVSAAHLYLESETWAAMAGLAHLYRGCSADWSFVRVLREKVGGALEA